MRLFILEADDALRETLGSAFRFAGHEVVLARTAIEALLRMGLEWMPELVLIDDASVGALAFEGALYGEPGLRAIPTLHFVSHPGRAEPTRIDGLEHVLRTLEEMQVQPRAA